MDVNQLLPAEMNQKGVKMEVTGGVPMELPSNMKPGQALKPYGITMTMDVAGTKMNTVIKAVGKCLAIEDVKVPAGTFKCHKITQTITTTVMGNNNVSTEVAWYAPNIGTVKTESYDDKNKLAHSSVLAELKGR